MSSESDNVQIAQNENVQVHKTESVEEVVETEETTTEEVTTTENLGESTPLSSESQENAVVTKREWVEEEVLDPEGIAGSTDDAEVTVIKTITEEITTHVSKEQPGDIAGVCTIQTVEVTTDPPAQSEEGTAETSVKVEELTSDRSVPEEAPKAEGSNEESAPKEEDKNIIDEVINDVAEGATKAMNWFRQSVMVFGDKKEEGTASPEQTTPTTPEITREAPAEGEVLAEGEAPKDAAKEGPKEDDLVDKFVKNMRRFSYNIGLSKEEESSDKKVEPIKEDNENLNAVMADTADKLNERGDKLDQVNQKSEQLENQAKGFADLAKEVADKQEKKKWWQL